jgi:hypothetical protein
VLWIAARDHTYMSVQESSWVRPYDQGLECEVDRVHAPLVS